MNLQYRPLTFLILVLFFTSILALPVAAAKLSKSKVVTKRTTTENTSQIANQTTIDALKELLEKTAPAAPSAPATGEQISWQVIAAGATNGSSTNYTLLGTVGQTAVGPGSSTNYILYQGFQQNFDAGGCCENPGDVNHSGGAVPTDVIDILYLVAYLFQMGPVPQCLDETDATGGCEGVGPDVIDLLAIVGYLFQEAGDLPACHNCGW